MTGNIFNIQLSIHDGPGIRTTILGCPLRCLCARTGISKQNTQLMYYRDLVPMGPALQPARFLPSSGCRQGCNRPGNLHQLRRMYRCLPRKGPGDYRPTDRSTGSCRQGLRRQNLFESSGGAFTKRRRSSQPEFAVAVLKRCKENGVHTIETCGFAQVKPLRRCFNTPIWCFTTSSIWTRPTKADGATTT